MKDKLFILMQYLLPQHLLSRCVAKLAACQVDFVKNTFIRWFVRRYQVDMALAEETDPLAYPDFNSFFTRALKAEARPIQGDEGHVICPADGAISEIGAIADDRILQAKGKSFGLRALLGGDGDLSAQFNGGSFATIYLSPRDYHRVHMPLEGVLREMIYVPGKLFSVNQVTAAHVDELFARNERAVCVFDTEHGPMALVLVGAMIVAGIDTVWAGQVAPAAGHGLGRTRYGDTRPAVQIARGGEMGRFRLGSTVIALFGPGMVTWQEQHRAGDNMQMGQIIGSLSNNGDGGYKNYSLRPHYFVPII